MKSYNSLFAVICLTGCLFVLALGVLPTLVQAKSAGDAKDDGWVLVATTPNATTFKIQASTIETLPSKDGNQSLLGIVQMETPEHDIVYRQVGVRELDCQRGYGKLASIALDTNKLTPMAFVRSGKNVASRIADTLCTVLEKIQASQGE